MTVAQWRMKQKMADFLGLKIPGSMRGPSCGLWSKCTTDFSSSSVCNSSRASYFQSGASQARTGIKRSKLAALLDFPNVIRPNESRPDDETSRIAAVWMVKKINRSLFPHVSEWEKVFLAHVASCELIMQRFGHYVKLTSMVGVVPGGLVESSQCQCQCQYGSLKTGF